ncbi:MAG: inositol 2-dehydrogenase, partial [Alphaproteobacteria bacterium]|nr:inositol 2-dehydrogenase [Alphaproteobacteria bacterium]
NAEINSFVQAINGKAPVEVGFEDGRIALLLAEAAFKSAHENRVIQVNEIN